MDANPVKRSFSRGIFATAVCTAIVAYSFLFSTSSSNESGHENRSYRICGRSWLDSDGSGLQKNENSGKDDLIGGVKVILSGSNDFSVTAITTNTGGSYLFDDLPAGDYQLSFEYMEGFKFTRSFGDKWSRGPRLSLVDPRTGKTRNFNLPKDVNSGADGQCDIQNVDAGYAPLGVDLAKNTQITIGAEIDTVSPNLSKGGEYSICGRVFNDVNHSNTQDGQDVVLTGVKVSLLNSNTELVGKPKLTAKGGRYRFSNLQSGSYHLKFELPYGFTGFVAKNAGKKIRWDNDVDGEGLSDVIVLPTDSNTGEKKNPACTIMWIDAGIK